jgi:small subunit ribosomal protein S17
MAESTPVKKKMLTGSVVSDAMDKTVVVRVSRVKKHPKYQKIMTVHKKFKAHDESNAYHVGDTVTIIASRPISKDKRWRVVNKKSTQDHREKTTH